MTAQTAPRDLKAPGRKIWRAVVGEYDLEEHESALLHELCRTADNLDALATIVAVEGVIEADTGKAHPALVESRQQRIAFARLAAALRLPAGDEEGDDKRSDTRRPQRRVGVRGIYGIAGGRSA